jgi:hypothetical protein
VIQVVLEEAVWVLDLVLDLDLVCRQASAPVDRDLLLFMVDSHEGVVLLVIVFVPAVTHLVIGMYFYMDFNLKFCGGFSCCVTKLSILNTLNNCFVTCVLLTAIKLLLVLVVQVQSFSGVDQAVV